MKMTIIRKIINWFKNLFRKLFGIKEKEKDKKFKISQRILGGKKTQTNIDTFFDETMPGYMIISDKEKEKLLYSLGIIKRIMIEKNDNEIEKEVIALLDYIKKNEKTDEKLINKIDKYGNELEKPLNIDFIKSLVKNFDNETKKEILDKYQLIMKKDSNFKTQVDIIDKLCEEIKKSDISIVAEDEIDKEVEDVTNDKKLDDELEEKVIDFNNNVAIILENVDKDILEEVMNNYKKVNYITLSTVIIDKNYKKFKELLEDYKNHRYNRVYYEREINRIKKEINRIKNLKNREDVNKHILELRKELYTKSKDKYDLLYNNEIFMNIEKECNDLLTKVNAKVVDMKKEKEKEQEQLDKEEKEEQDEKKNEEEKELYLKNILRRFMDLELARMLILSAKKEEVKLETREDVERYIGSIYTRFSDDINMPFNYERNKCKTQFAILYNGLSRVISETKKEEYTPIDHINFRMDDLVEAVKVKKSEVEGIMHSKHIDHDGLLVDEKIDNLVENNYHYVNKNSRVLKKK